MAVDQGELAFARVGAPVEDDLVLRRQRRVGRVDAADEEPGIVDVRERGEALAAGGEQDARAQGPDACGRLVQVVDPVPAIPVALAPTRPLEPQERDAGLLARFRRRRRDALGERDGWRRRPR